MTASPASVKRLLTALKNYVKAHPDAAISPTKTIQYGGSPALLEMRDAVTEILTPRYRAVRVVGDVWGIEDRLGTSVTQHVADHLTEKQARAVEATLNHEEEQS